jgi:hypothetical protein
MRSTTSSTNRKSTQSAYNWRQYQPSSNPGIDFSLSDRVRLAVLISIPECKAIVASNGYSDGWIWRELKRCYQPFTENELIYIASQMGFGVRWVQRRLEIQKRKTKSPPSRNCN